MLEYSSVQIETTNPGPRSESSVKQSFDSAQGCAGLQLLSGEPVEPEGEECSALR